MIWTVFQSEFRQLKRNKVVLAMLAVFILLSAYSIYYGHQAISIQRNKIIAAADSVKRLQANNVALLKADTNTIAGKNDYEKATMPSLVRFNYSFLVANRPASLAELSIGQRDIFPLNYILNGQSLYVQTLKGEIYNPFKLSAGNFDLSFVIIYLLPLVIIALAFDVLAAERETGTEKLLRTASPHFKSVILYRLLFRLCLVALIITLICLAAFGIAGEIELLTGLVWLLVTWIYTTLWFGILLLINTYQKSTSFNALVALSVWIMLLLVIPAGISLMIKSQRKTHSLQLAGLMRSRNMPETDQAMSTALSEFYDEYPEYRPADTVKGKFFYFQGYSAFLLNGDRRAQQVLAGHNAGLAADEKRYALFNIINPAANAQGLFNTLAGSGLSNEWQFKKSVQDFHRQIFWFANRPLFQNRLMTERDYQEQPVFTQAKPPLNYKEWLAGITYLIAGTAIVYLAALIKFRP